jgi:hypothetical protein
VRCAAVCHRYAARNVHRNAIAELKTTYRPSGDQIGVSMSGDTRFDVQLVRR